VAVQRELSQNDRANDQQFGERKRMKVNSGDSLRAKTCGFLDRKKAWKH
jgi:hypothetical protein